MHFHEAKRRTKQLTLRFKTLIHFQQFPDIEAQTEAKGSPSAALILNSLIRHALFMSFSLNSISKNPHSFSAFNQSVKAGLGTDWPPYI